MASSRMMRYNNASLQRLIYCHLRPTAAAATHFVNNSSASVIPPPELRQSICRPIAQEAAGSEIKFAQAPFQLLHGLTAEKFVKRIECRGRIEIEDDENNYGDDEEGDFNEDDEDYDSDTIGGEMDDDDDSDGDFDEDEDDGGDYRR